MPTVPDNQYPSQIPWMDTILHKLFDMLVALQWASISLTCGTILVFVLFLRWHKDGSTFDLRDAFIGVDGRFSVFKTGQTSALALSSWAFANAVLLDHLSMEMFYGYMGLWSGVSLAKHIWGNPANDNPVPTQPNPPTEGPQ